MTEFEIVATEIENASTPSELFGPVAQDHARKMWIDMQRIVHPDKVADEFKARANAVSAKLNNLWGQVSDSLNTGIIMGTKKTTFVLGTRRYQYVLTPYAKGQTCGIFSAVIQDRNSAVFIRLTS